jgi:hypothetical protein
MSATGRKINVPRLGTGKFSRTLQLHWQVMLDLVYNNKSSMGDTKCRLMERVYPGMYAE